MEEKKKRVLFSKKKALQSNDIKTFIKGVIYMLKDNVTDEKTTAKEKTLNSNLLRGISEGWDKEKDKEKIKKVSALLKKIEPQLISGKNTVAQQKTFLKLSEMYPRFEAKATKSKPTAKDILSEKFSKMLK